MTQAEEFKESSPNYSYDLENWEKSVGETYFAEYQIKFKDLSILRAILSYAQRNKVLKKKLGDTIDKIGGMGYRFKKS